MRIDSILELTEDDCLALLEAEQSLIEFLPKEGIPNCRALFKLFEKCSAVISMSRQCDLNFCESEEKQSPSIEVINRRGILNGTVSKH